MKTLLLIMIGLVGLVNCVTKVRMAEDFDHLARNKGSTQAAWA